MPKSRQRQRSLPRRRASTSISSPTPLAAVPSTSAKASPEPLQTDRLVLGELRRIGIISGGILVLLLVLFFLWR